MKKWTSILLCFALMLSSMVVLSAAAEPAPAIGDQVNGFTLKEIGALDVAGATTYLYEHDKSGAQVFYIQNSDTNRAFDITFKTPTLDDTGMPHVFEHAVLGGSARYPAPNIAFTLSNQTYNTFVNGMTGTTYTTYPVASLSEAQLRIMMDVYLSGMFEPLLLTEPRLVKREAWRYEMEDADAPITIAGTVYSEMMGANTIGSTAELALIQALYPGSTFGNNAGGTLEHIPELTHERLVNFHETYYHPSNALVILYGDLDCARFLQDMDENYFSAYDRRDIVVEDGRVEVPTGHVEETVEFPVERDVPATDASVIHYAFALDGIDKQDAYGMSVVTSIMTHESSPLTKAIRSALPGVRVSAYIDSLTTMPYVTFMLNSANPGDAQVLKTIVDEQLASLSGKGFDRDIVESVIAQMRFGILTLPEMSALGVNLSTSIAAYWSVDGSLTYFNDIVSNLEAIAEKKDTGYLESLAQMLLDAERTALITVVPVPGKAEENAAALAEQLAQYKASLTDEEIAAMVTEAREITEWSAQETSKEIIEQIQAVSVSDLPEEQQTFALTDQEMDGVRRLTAEAEVDQIGFTLFGLPTDFVKQKDLPYLTLYAQLLGSMPTEKYSREQVANLVSTYLSGFTAQPGTFMEKDSDTPDYLFTLQWMSLMDHYEEDVALVDEVLFHTDFSDVEELKSFVARAIATQKQMITASSVNIQLYRAMAIDDPEAQYQLMIGGLDYHRFLQDVQVLLGQEPGTVVARLEEIRDLLRNRQGAISMFAGNAEGVSASAKVLDAYFAELPETEHEPAFYVYENLPAAREAMVIDSQVQFNILYASFDSLGVEADGRLEVLASLLSDGYLIPVLRHQMGAYSVIANVGTESLFFYSYRDPNLKETFEVYDGAGEFLRGLTLDQATIDPYILSTYSGYAMPIGQLNGALRAITRHIENRTDEERLDQMRQIKSLKAEDVAELSKVFDALSAMGVRATSGSQAAIEENAELFDVILKPLAEASGDVALDQAA